MSDPIDFFAVGLIVGCLVGSAGVLAAQLARAIDLERTNTGRPSPRHTTGGVLNNSISGGAPPAGVFAGYRESRGPDDLIREVPVGDRPQTPIEWDRLRPRPWR